MQNSRWLTRRARKSIVDFRGAISDIRESTKRLFKIALLFAPLFPCGKATHKGSTEIDDEPQKSPATGRAFLFRGGFFCGPFACGCRGESSQSAGAELVHGVNENTCVHGIHFRGDAMAEVEDMPVVRAEIRQDAFHFGADRIRRGV